MLFNTDFNYTDIKTFLNQRIDGLNGEITICDSKMEHLSNISGFDDLVIPTQSNITSTISIYNDMKGNVELLKTEIETLETLGNIAKENLYDLWDNVLSNTSETKGIYMQRMLYNHSELIVEGNAILSDVILSSDDKVMLAGIVCANIPIHQNTHLILGHNFAD